MPDLLFELFSEEIPARMQRQAAADLGRLATGALAEAGLVAEGTYASATPRRLVLHMRGLPVATAERVEERRGPRVGAPEKAVAGFARSAGLASIAEAEIARDPKKGDYYVARITHPGRPTPEILAEVLPRIVATFPWPKSMRWGAASAEANALRWIRPLKSVVCTFGPETEEPEVVSFPLDGVPVGDVTHGHRFMAPGPIRVRRLDDYVASLKAARVVVDLDRRRDMILHDARDRALALGLELVEDDALLEEVAGLVEWPVVLVGRFDAAFLSLPDEVVRLTIRENQKCFVLRDPATGALADRFVLAANIEAPDGGERIVGGNERVVRARLSDARFFLETDLARPLAEHAAALAHVVFHDRLGTQAERVERIARLAREIAPAVGADPDRAEEAARLAKADLVTGLVGEFPELQGYVGHHYALAEGRSPAVAAAIEEHYRPLGPADRVPSEPVAIAVALADKIDTLVGFFAIGETPTGSKDPYALRRAALGVIRIVLENRVRLPLQGPPERLGPLPFARWELLTQKPEVAGEADDARVEGETGPTGAPPAHAAFPDRDATMLTALVGFVLERLKVQLRQEGARHDLVDAVIGLDHHGDILRIADRVEALGTFLATPDGENLLQGHRRAANILRAEERRDGRPVAGRADRTALAEPAERALAEAIDAVETRVAAAVAEDDYAGALDALAGLRAPVDRFFEEILVNAEDPAVRANRLRLVAEIPRVTGTIADFSQIAG